MVLMVCTTLHLLPYMIWSYYILGLKDCSVLCKGIYTTKSTQPLEDQSYNCVWFNISFKLNETLTSKFADFRCGMQDCILDVIEFECTFNRNYTGIPLNNTPSNEKNQINQPVTNDRNGSLNMNDDQNQETYEGNGSCISKFLYWLLFFYFLYFYIKKHQLVKMMECFNICRSWYKRCDNYKLFGWWKLNWNRHFCSCKAFQDT